MAEAARRVFAAAERHREQGASQHEECRARDGVQERPRTAPALCRISARPKQAALRGNAQLHRTPKDSPEDSDSDFIERPVACTRGSIFLCYPHNSARQAMGNTGPKSPSELKHSAEAQSGVWLSRAYKEGAPCRFHLLGAHITLATQHRTTLQLPQGVCVCVTGCLHAPPMRHPCVSPCSHPTLNVKVIPHRKVGRGGRDSLSEAFLPLSLQKVNTRTAASMLAHNAPCL